MAAIGYRAGRLTRSPLDFNVCLWPSSNSGAPAPGLLLDLHRRLAERSGFPMEHLVFNLWAGGPERAVSKDAMRIADASAFDEHLDCGTAYLRIDGPFFGISVDRRAIDAGGAAIVGFISSFDIPEAAMELYASSEPIEGVPGNLSEVKNLMSEISAQLPPPTFALKGLVDAP